MVVLLSVFLFFINSVPNRLKVELEKQINSEEEKIAERENSLLKLCQSHFPLSNVSNQLTATV
jgi:hypothetical protein